jgi:hypothetical protein
MPTCQWKLPPNSILLKRPTSGSPGQSSKEEWHEGKGKALGADGGERRISIRSRTRLQALQDGGARQDIKNRTSPTMHPENRVNRRNKGKSVRTAEVERIAAENIRANTLPPAVLPRAPARNPSLVVLPRPPAINPCLVVYNAAFAASICKCSKNIWYHKQRILNGGTRPGQQPHTENCPWKGTHKDGTRRQQHKLV